MFKDLEYRRSTRNPAAESLELGEQLTQHINAWEKLLRCPDMRGIGPKSEVTPRCGSCRREQSFFVEKHNTHGPRQAEDITTAVKSVLEEGLGFAVVRDPKHCSSCGVTDLFPSIQTALIGNSSNVSFLSNSSVNDQIPSTRDGSYKSKSRLLVHLRSRINSCRGALINPLSCNTTPYRTSSSALPLALAPALPPTLDPVPVPLHHDNNIADQYSLALTCQDLLFVNNTLVTISWN